MVKYKYEIIRNIQIGLVADWDGQNRIVLLWHCGRCLLVHFLDAVSHCSIGGRRSFGSLSTGESLGQSQVVILADRPLSRLCS